MVARNPALRLTVMLGAGSQRGKVTEDIPRLLGDNAPTKRVRVFPYVIRTTHRIDVVACAGKDPREG